MDIRHPYNFVPLKDGNVRKEPWGAGPAGHERWDAGRHSGTFVCKLKTETLLCIRSVFERLKGLRLMPVIPGSSIKGMARGVAQALGVGCAYKYPSPDADVKLSKKLRPCDKKGACLVCRIFGYSAEGEEFGWAGKARFSDAEIATAWNVRLWEELPKGGGRWPSPKPRTRHKAFYFSGDDPLGWKVYRHARNPRAAVVSEKATFWTGACVGVGTEFEFTVTYENLTDLELAVLRFVLTLEHECAEHHRDSTFAGHTLAHKLGYGKPAGLGSCTTRIVEEREENPRRYFGETEGQGASTAQGQCPLRGLLASASFAEFREYLAWDTRADHLLFPTKDGKGGGWFDQNPTATIEDYEKSGVGKWVLVRITEVGKYVVKSKVERDGRTYTGVSSPSFEGLEAGGECFVWVTECDHSAGTFKGITA